MRPKFDLFPIVANFKLQFSLHLNVVLYFLRIDKLLFVNDETIFKMPYNTLNRFYGKSKKSCPKTSSLPLITSFTFMINII